MSTTATTMKGAVVEEYGKPLVIRTDLKVPEPGPNQLRLKIATCSLCMSDIAGWAGHLGAPLPYCAGHEPVGYVDAIGPGVSGFNVGERVGYMPASKTCQKCADCLSAEHRFCDKKTNAGFDGLAGGFSEYAIADPLSTAHIPDGISDEAAAPLLCAGVTAYGAVKKASKAQPGGTLVNIVGCGGVGHLVVLYAKAMGFKVHAFDVAEDKLALAKDCGADAVFDSRNLAPDSVPRAISTIVVSGAAAAYNSALDITARRGQIIAIGVPNQPIPINLLKMVMDCISIIVTNQGTKLELVESLELAASAGIKPVVEVRSIDTINEGFQDLMTGKTTGRIVYKF